MYINQEKVLSVEMTAAFRSVLTLICFLTVWCNSLVGHARLLVGVDDDKSVVKKVTMMDQSQLHADSCSYLCPGYKWNDELKCTHHDGILLKIGYCITRATVKGNGTYYVTKCPYFELKGHNTSVTKSGYIKLPDNISELNDYMCGSVNRKGLLCKDCMMVLLFQQHQLDTNVSTVQIHGTVFHSTWFWN